MDSDRLFTVPKREMSVKAVTAACSRIQESHESIARGHNIKLTLDNLFLDLVGVLK